MKWIYQGKRKRLFGKWCYPGDIINNNTKPPGDWIKSSKEKITLNDKVGQSTESTRIEEYRKKLLKEKMKELRKIGKPYGVNDNDKKELIEEIIQAKINKGDI